jgi:glutaredoxin
MDQNQTKMIFAVIVGLVIIGMVIIGAIALFLAGFFTPNISPVQYAALPDGTLAGSATGSVAETIINKYDAFAKCITQKNATLYGASWCPHCNDQKELFGAELEHINYVECASPSGGQTSACSTAKITAYPTWIINGQKTTGAKTLEELAKLTGCALS